MKSFYVCLALFGVCLMLFLALCRPNFLDHTELNSYEGLSSWLSYQVEYHPSHGTEEARFTVTLTNVSRYYLSLELNDKKFHGLLMVKHGWEREYEILDKGYRMMLMTSLWSEPMTYLAPSKSVTWTMSLSTLEDLNGVPVTEASLASSVIYARMKVTIEPTWRLADTYVEGNASKQSAPIQIPLLGNAARSAVPYRPGQERFLDWCLRATSYP